MICIFLFVLLLCMCCVLHLSGEWEQQHTRATKFFRRCKPNKRTKVSARTAVASRAKSLSEPVAVASRRVASRRRASSIRNTKPFEPTTPATTATPTERTHTTLAQKPTTCNNNKCNVMAISAGWWRHGGTGCTFNTTHSSQHNCKSHSDQGGKCVYFLVLYLQLAPCMCVLVATRL